MSIDRRMDKLLSIHTILYSNKNDSQKLLNLKKKSKVNIHYTIYIKFKNIQNLTFLLGIHTYDVTFSNKRITNTKFRITT